MVGLRVEPGAQDGRAQTNPRSYAGPQCFGICLKIDFKIQIATEAGVGSGANYLQKRFSKEKQTFSISFSASKYRLITPQRTDIVKTYLTLLQVHSFYDAARHQAAILTNLTCYKHTSM